MKERHRRRCQKRYQAGWITGIEVVDEFLDADGICWGHITVIHIAPGNAVRSGIHIQGKSGEMIFKSIDEGVYTVILEIIASGGCAASGN